MQAEDEKLKINNPWPNENSEKQCEFFSTKKK